MKRSTHFLLVFAILALAFPLGGCSHFSKQSRQERAYYKYVRKSSIARERQGLKFRHSKTSLPPMPVSEPMIAAQSGPQGMPSESSSE